MLLRPTGILWLRLVVCKNLVLLVFGLQEIVSSKQFNENLKIFLDMTDGSEEGSDIHVVKTGEEIGDDFSDEVNPYYQKNPEKLKEDIARLQVGHSFCCSRRLQVSQRY